MIDIKIIFDSLSYLILNHKEVKMENSSKISENGKLVEEKFIVEYRNQLYDITEFMRKHPGGINTLHGYNRKDIEEKFRKVDHSAAAEYLLKDYKLKKHVDESNNDVFDDSMEVSCVPRDL